MSPVEMCRAPKWGVSTWSLPSRGAAALRWARHAGFDIVHLDRHDLESTPSSALAHEAARLELTLGGLAVVDLETVGLNEPGASSCVDRVLDLACELDVTYVYLPAFGAAEITSRDTLGRMADLLNHALAAVEDSEIMIATENTLDIRSQLELFERVGDDRLLLLFDTQNPAYWGHRPAALVAAFADRIDAYVHVKDGCGELGNRRIGDGDADVETSIVAIARSGFDGVFVLESDYRSGDPNDARIDQERLHRLLARHGWST